MSSNCWVVWTSVQLRLSHGQSFLSVHKRQTSVLAVRSIHSGERLIVLLPTTQNALNSTDDPGEPKGFARRRYSLCM